MERRFCRRDCACSARARSQCAEMAGAPIEMIIPFPAGSGVDVIGRAVATALAEQSGQHVIVHNRDGAAGTIGFNALAAAAPDGHTIAFGPTTPIANAPYLVKGVRYNVEFVRLHLPDFRERLHDRGRARVQIQIGAGPARRRPRRIPGKLTYGHAGLRHHSASVGRELRRRLKLKFQAVPFRGDAPVLPALLKGDIDFGAPAVSTIHGQNFRPLVVFWQARHPAYPDVPIARELGAATEVPPGHNGLYAPSGLPARCQDGVGAALRRRREERSGATDHHQYRTEHPLSQRRRIPGADNRRLPIQGRVDPAPRPGRAIGARRRHCMGAE